jgi:thiol:disulfide interchange protein DsbD
MEKVKLYTDGGEDAGRNQELQFELTGTLALPTYVILDPESGTVLDQLIGYTEAEKFESFLNRGLQRYQQIQNKES